MGQVSFKKYIIYCGGFVIQYVCIRHLKIIWSLGFHSIWDFADFGDIKYISNCTFDLEANFEICLRTSLFFGNPFCLMSDGVMDKTTISFV